MEVLFFQMEILFFRRQQGLKKFSQMHDDVEVFVACIDEGLNEKGYIIPGLGDAGDRVFNTL